MATTIYFSGSISAGRDDVPIYRRIVAALEGEGHRVLAGAVVSLAVSAGGEPFSAQEIFRRDLAWLAEAKDAGGVLVADVSKPSTGVGYEIGLARYLLRMRVICLYRPAYTSRCSAMIAGDDGIRLLEYTEEGLEPMIAELCRLLREQ